MISMADSVGFLLNPIVVEICARGCSLPNGILNPKKILGFIRFFFQIFQIFRIFSDGLDFFGLF